MTDPGLALQRLADFLAEETLAMSDAEILQEMRDQGLDPEAEAEAMRVEIAAVIAKARPPHD